MTKKTSFYICEEVSFSHILCNPEISKHLILISSSDKIIFKVYSNKGSIFLGSTKLIIAGIF